MKKLLSVLLTLSALGVVTTPIMAEPLALGDQADRAITSLLQLFGTDLDSEYPETLITNVYAEYLAFIYSGAIIWLLYQLATATFKGAQDGDAWGKGNNPTLGFIRLAGSVMGLIPSFSGTPLILYVILFFAQVASWGANLLTDSIADGVADRVLPMTIPQHAAGENFMIQMLDVLACIETYNQANIIYARRSSPMTFETVTPVRQGVVHFRSSAVRGVTAGTCGSIKADFNGMVGANQFVNDVSVSQQLSAVQTVHVKGIEGVKAALEPITVQMSSRALNPKSTKPFNITQDMIDELAVSVLAYDYAVLRTSKFLQDEKGQLIRDKFAQKTKACGWTCLGQVWLNLSAISGRTANAGRYRPEITSPNYTKFSQSSLRPIAKALFRVREMKKDALDKMAQVTGNVSPFAEKALDLQNNPDVGVISAYVSTKFWTVLAPLIVETGLDTDGTPQLLNANVGTMQVFSAQSNKILNQAGIVDYNQIKAQLRTKISTAPTPAQMDPYRRSFQFALSQGSQDPISRMTDLGHSLITASEIAQLSFIAANAAVAALDGAGESFWGDLVAAQTLTNALVTGVQQATDYFQLFVLFFLAAGVYFAFILPFYMYIQYIVAVLGWIFRVVELSIMAPIWMIVHMNFKGDEFIEHRMVPGYIMLIEILFKPILIVFGFLVSIAMFYIGNAFILADFPTLMVNIVGDHTAGIVTAFAVVLMMGVAMVFITKQSSRAITELPDYTFSKMFGISPSGARDTADAEQVLGGMAAGRQLENMAGAQAVKGVGGAIGRGVGKAATKGYGNATGSVDVKSALPPKDSRADTGTEKPSDKRVSD